MLIYILKDGSQSGPHTEAEAFAMLASGSISRQHLAWKEGLTEWQPIESIIGCDRLPPCLEMPADLLPLPPVYAIYHTENPQSALPALPASAIRTTSGIIALVLGVLAAISIGGCVNAQHKLDAFETGSNASDGAQMFISTLQGMNQGDPLKGVQGLFDRHESLNTDLEDFRLGAWLCFIGMAVAGGVFTFSGVPPQTRRL